MNQDVDLRSYITENITQCPFKEHPKIHVKRQLQHHLWLNRVIALNSKSSS